MHPVLLKTFGGLTKAYYFRQLVFATAFAAFFIFTELRSSKVEVPLWVYVWLLASTLLYPYARFVYESIIDFVVGDNQYSFYGVLLVIRMVVKLIMMSICFSLAIFIAPVGLAYLYYHHSKPA